MFFFQPAIRFLLSLPDKSMYIKVRLGLLGLNVSQVKVKFRLGKDFG